MAEKKNVKKKAGVPAEKKNTAKSAGKNKTGGTERKGQQEFSEEKPKKKHSAGSRMRDEIIAIIMLAAGIFLIISLMTNATGAFGEILAMVLKGVFGLTAMLLPFLLIIYSVLILMNRMAHVNSRSVVFSILLFIDLSMLDSVRFDALNSNRKWMDYFWEMFQQGYALESAGTVGMTLGRLVNAGLGKPGLVILALAIMAVCVIMIADTPVSVFFDRLRENRLDRQLEREAEQEAYELEKAERNARREARKKEKRLSQALPLPEPEHQQESTPAIPMSEKAVQETVPLSEPLNYNVQEVKEDASGEAPALSGLKIKGLHLFQNGFNRKTEKDAFSDRPENQRKILNYVKDGALSESEAGEAGTEFSVKGLSDEELRSFRAEDFFYEIPKQSTDITSEQEEFEPVLSVEELLASDIAGQETMASNMPKQEVKLPERHQEAAPAAAAVPMQTNAEKKAAVAMETAALQQEISNAQNAPVKKEYVLPPLDLLNPPARKINQNEARELAAKAAQLEQVFVDFGVHAHVVDVKRGPAVTRYEIQPATGVKVSSITKLADDIALNLEAKSLRIEAPIPGKAAVGIEIQNDSSSMVSIREMIGSKEFEESKSKISFVVGEDIAGNHITADLKTMPHLLIAGSTGSGKSVCINSLIVSMLYKSTPDEVKFILIDPKVVELGNYNGIPHMLIPVVTDPSRAAAALAWAVQEMNDRYRKFAESAVRDLKGYNEKLRKDGRENEVLPQIVIIIDELADLMMAAAKQVEESICRLAQLARAAGMHLVVATQRPSVDVVTGLIKANIPSRIAFAVSSQVDSRTILDRVGAEKLVGKGDMMFYPLGKAQPERLQGPFVTDDEVTAVIDFWKEQAGDETASANRILEKINTAMPETIVEDEENEDELLPEAIELVVTSGQASASMLQRRYRIGYNRAGRLIDIMEARGIIGPNEGSKPRKVLMSKEELDHLNGVFAEEEAEVYVESETEQLHFADAAESSTEAAETAFVPSDTEDSLT